MCQNLKNMKTMHFMHFFDDKCPCLANQFWEIHVQHRKMEQKHWKQRTVGPCFAMWSKNGNFLTFLRMEMTCFSCKKMHRIFQDPLRTANICVKYWKKTRKWCNFSICQLIWAQNSNFYVCNLPLFNDNFLDFPRKGRAYPGT